jgi:hypothetical protein
MHNIKQNMQEFAKNNAEHATIMQIMKENVHYVCEYMQDMQNKFTLHAKNMTAPLA